MNVSCISVGVVMPRLPSAAARLSGTPSDVNVVMVFSKKDCIHLRLLVRRRRIAAPPRHCCGRCAALLCAQCAWNAPPRKIRLAVHIICRHATPRECGTAPEIAVFPLALLHDAAPARGAGNAPAARNLRRQRRIAEIARKRRLSRKEFLGRPLALRHRVQTILPDRRRIGVGHRVGQRVNEEIRRLGRCQYLFLARRMEELAPN